VSDTPIFLYPGKDADVTWDRRLCIHIGECGQARGDLFVGGRKPWCQPDLASVAEIVDVCARCPSGQLAIDPLKDGPLRLKGNLAIVAATGWVRWRGTEAFRYRCCHPKNKPFCDGSHEAAGFNAG